MRKQLERPRDQSDGSARGQSTEKYISNPLRIQYDSPRRAQFLGILSAGSSGNGNFDTIDFHYPDNHCWGAERAASVCRVPN